MNCFAQLQCLVYDPFIMECLVFLLAVFVCIYDIFLVSSVITSFVTKWYSTGGHSVESGDPLSSMNFIISSMCPSFLSVVDCDES